MARYAETYRITKETEVKAQLDLDGEGKTIFKHRLSFSITC